jgi:hypothetical protein
MAGLQRRLLNNPYASLSRLDSSPDSLLKTPE